MKLLLSCSLEDSPVKWRDTAASSGWHVGRVEFWKSCRCYRKGWFRCFKTTLICSGDECRRNSKRPRGKMHTLTQSVIAVTQQAHCWQSNKNHQEESVLVLSGRVTRETHLMSGWPASFRRKVGHRWITHSRCWNIWFLIYLFIFNFKSCVSIWKMSKTLSPAGQSCQILDSF